MQIVFFVWGTYERAPPSGTVGFAPAPVLYEGAP